MIALDKCQSTHPDNWLKGHKLIKKLNRGCSDMRQTTRQRLEGTFLPGIFYPDSDTVRS